ncbi:MAG: tryptophan synthase subunit alpha [Flavobacteriales bacterium]|nr:tryptophan synthase subunit alpha [Flavobacteriales bacterium]
MRLDEKLSIKRQKLLSIFATAGFPKLDSLPSILDAVDQNGVDILEVGIPYSDPISDGPIIQNSNSIALKNGITLELIFDQLKSYPSSVPKVMMGYFNSVLQFGIERFCIACNDSGISGVILPDLPPEIYLKEYAVLFKQNNLSNIFLITPETSKARIQWIDKNSTTFIYAVSSSGTTGKKQGIKASLPFLKRLNQIQLDHPVLIGFNIKRAADFSLAARYTNGGIIGSAFIQQLAHSENIPHSVKQFVSQIIKN